MNTTNGNFIEKSIPKNSDATINVKIGNTDSTMNLVDFKTAMASNSSVNYKSYVATINQTGTNAPVATVLENTLGGTPIWTRSTQGQYVLSLPGAFPASKTVYNSAILTGYDNGSSFPYIISRSNNGQMEVDSYSGLDGQFVNAIVDIKVYN